MLKKVMTIKYVYIMLDWLKNSEGMKVARGAPIVVHT